MVLLPKKLDETCTQSLNGKALISFHFFNALSLSFSELNDTEVPGIFFPHSVLLFSEQDTKHYLNQHKIGRILGCPITTRSCIQKKVITGFEI